MCPNRSQKTINLDGAYQWTNNLWNTRDEEVDFGPWMLATTNGWKNNSIGPSSKQPIQLSGGGNAPEQKKMSESGGPSLGTHRQPLSMRSYDIT